MNEKENAIVVFTARSPERLVREGGSQSWLLNPARAKSCTWLVCTQNRHNPNHEFSDATEPHGAGFLLGKISGVHRSLGEDGKERWIIQISEFARINYPDLWDHGRNPVRYTSLERLEIDTSTLKWEPVPGPDSTPAPVVATPSAGNSKATAAALTMAEAKRGLALTFNVPPEAIEITIRG